MKHYFVAKTQKRLGDMIAKFLFAYQISKVIEIKDLGKTENGKNWSICIEFEDGYGEFDPKSDGQVHYDHGDIEEEIRKATEKYLKTQAFFYMVSTPNDDKEGLKNNGEQ